MGGGYIYACLFSEKCHLAGSASGLCQTRRDIWAIARWFIPKLTGVPLSSGEGFRHSIYGVLLRRLPFFPMTNEGLSLRPGFDWTGQLSAPKMASKGAQLCFPSSVALNITLFGNP